MNGYEERLAELKRQANDAIWTHHRWVSVLKRAIATRRCPIGPDAVADHTGCPIGVWLARDLDADARQSPLYTRTCDVHAAFHHEAAAVVSDALAGRRDEATTRMAPGGAFGLAAMRMRSTLYEWANVAEPDDSGVDG